MAPVTHPEEARPILAHVPSHNSASSRSALKLLGLAASVVLASVVLAGCGIFDPTQGGPPPKIDRPVYAILSQPGFVLNALELAYSHRDSTGYKALYDSSYVGTSEDLNDPPGTVPISFTYADEVAHVAALERSPTITSVTFELGPETSWTRLESDDPSHPEYAVIQIAGSNLDIQVTEGSNTLRASGSSEFFEFTFKPTTPAPGSPSDTLWKIVKWRESRAAVGP